MTLALEIAGGYLVAMMLAIRFFVALCRVGARLDPDDEGDRRDRGGDRGRAPVARRLPPAPVMPRRHLATVRAADPRR